MHKTRQNTLYYILKYNIFVIQFLKYIYYFEQTVMRFYIFQTQL